MALHDETRVAARTRERVRRVAREIGYVRNSVAATLATRRTTPVHGLGVAVVSFYKKAGHWSDDASYRLVEARLNELGYVSHNFNLFGQGLSAAKLRSLAYHRGYAGVIFTEIRDRHDEIFSLDWSPFALAAMGRYYHPTPCNMFREDPYGTVTLAWEKVREAGYRRAGFLLCRHSPLIIDDFEREAAFLRQRQESRAPEENVTPSLGPILDEKEIEKWYFRHRPDVVVGFNDGHYLILKEMGLRIPQDVAYVNLQGQTTPNISAVCPGTVEISGLCADHIDFLIRHKRTGYPQRPSTISVAVSWIPGETMPSPALSYRSIQPKPSKTHKLDVKEHRH